MHIAPWLYADNKIRRRPSGQEKVRLSRIEVSREAVLRKSGALPARWEVLRVERLAAEMKVDRTNAGIAAGFALYASLANFALAG